MNQLVSVWNTLDMRRRIIVIGATIAVFATVLGLARMASQPRMSLLYAGLEPGAAGEVISMLDASGAKYEVRGDSIFVDAARRDALRMTLASEGLPKTSVKGYELLDSLSGFGTTSQMFDATYWRAKEGELARTIMAVPSIQSARVHIANAGGQGLRSRAKPSASVVVNTGGSSISASHAKALKFLISSAVAGLAPEDVAVIDSSGNLVATGDETKAAGRDTAERSEELRRAVERLLEARVGYGNAVVQVSLDTVNEQSKIVERVVDPNSRVAISSEKEASNTNSTDSRQGGVSVASNLPSGKAAADGSSSAKGSETRERIAYDVSSTTREVLKSPGAIRRLSVAVLVDGLQGTDKNGAPIWKPRPQQELDALRELVASAVGFDESRGDKITIKSMQFEPLPVEGTAAQTSLIEQLGLDVGGLLQLGTLSLVALGLGMFVLRPILLGSARQAAVSPASLPVPESGASAGLQGLGAQSFSDDADGPPLPALMGEIDDGHHLPQMATVGDFDLIEDVDANNHTDSDPVERLRALIDARQDETVEILRGWMEAKEEEV